MITKKSEVLTWFATATFALLVAGCGPPQAAPQNQRLIASLRTAISAQNSEWLEKNAEVLEKRRAAGQVSDVVLQTFQTIIDKARAGQWEEAEREVMAFQKAQRPTREQIDHVTKGARKAASSVVP